MESQGKSVKKVLVINTGGTIGMVENAAGALAPVANAMEAFLRNSAGLNDEAVLRAGGWAQQWLALPLPEVAIYDDAIILYRVMEYRPLLDSSNMTGEERIRIAKTIRDNYDNYDGFVILHGTDTMTLSGSYLSYMLENLNKPVILTGAQIPLYDEENSDGAANIYGSLVLAANPLVAGVSIFFDSKLFQANRTIKRSCAAMDAFESPNWPLLATLNHDGLVEVNREAIWRPEAGHRDELHVQTQLSSHVVFLSLFPDISGEFVRRNLAHPVAGAVIACYGAGNMPSNNADLLAALGEAHDRGVILVSVTQCRHGAVTGVYETAMAAEAAGVIPCGDMTWEAAYTKLAYILAKKGLSNQERRAAMRNSIRGEMSV
jgi:60kDa lysophospholipase